MRNKTRVKQLGEVFTPPELVNEMLDKLPEEVWRDAEKTFLDNSCGNGNFLVEVLKRKIKAGHKPLYALSTIYGIDIMNDNVLECQARLYCIVKQHTKKRDHRKAAAILRKNIVCADALKYNYEFK